MSGNITDALGESFDSTTVEIKEQFELLPKGEYFVVIEDAELRATRTFGKMLVAKFTVLTGPQEGRVIFENMNIVNDSEKAVKIARETFAKICRAIGHEHVSDTSELVGKRLIISVDIKEPPKDAETGETKTYIGKDGNQYTEQAKNTIKAYKPSASGVPPTSGAQPISGSTPGKEAEPKKAAPWAKK